MGIPSSKNDIIDYNAGSNSNGKFERHKYRLPYRDARTRAHAPQTSLDRCAASCRSKRINLCLPCSLCQTRGDCLAKNGHLEVWATQQQAEETLRKWLIHSTFKLLSFPCLTVVKWRGETGWFLRSCSADKFPLCSILDLLHWVIDFIGLNDTIKGS